MVQHPTLTTIGPNAKQANCLEYSPLIFEFSHGLYLFQIYANTDGIAQDGTGTEYSAEDIAIEALLTRSKNCYYSCLIGTAMTTFSNQILSADRPS